MGFGASKPQSQGAKKKPVTKAMMKRYLELERKVRKLEKDQVLQTLQLKQGQLTDLESTIRQLQEHYNQCVMRVRQEMKDVAWAAQSTVQSFFDNDAALAKEQSEYLEACNNEEMARKELEGMNTHKARVAQDVHVLHMAAQKLENIYAEQDKLLDEIFNGQYGSERENMTESQLDALVTRQEKINAAKYKWSNAVVLLQYTVSQLGVAVNAWTNILRMHDMQRRYLFATQARDNLSSACRNILTAQLNLSHIQFPYCKPDEVNTVNVAVMNIYTDMQSPERHAHALNLYSVTHQRATSLLQWLKHVVTNTIEPDLKRINEAVKAKEQELKAERLRLIRERMQQLNTGSSDSDSSSDESDDEFATLLAEANQTAWHMPAIISLKQQASTINQGAAKTGEALKNRVTSVMDKMRTQLGSIAGAAKDSGSEFQKVVLAVMAKEALVAEPPKPDTEELPTTTEDEGAGEKDESGEPGKAAPPPLPLDELAPPPNQEDLFGDIEELKKRHEHELEELAKVQEMNKVRQEQDLHAKLKARRNRRKRLDMQAKEEHTS